MLIGDATYPIANREIFLLPPIIDPPEIGPGVSLAEGELYRYSGGCQGIDCVMTSDFSSPP